MLAVAISERDEQQLASLPSRAESTASELHENSASSHSTKIAVSPLFPAATHMGRMRLRTRHAGTRPTLLVIG